MFFLKIKNSQAKEVPNRKSFFKRGFSLVELIMVVAIFLVICGIILSKQSKFSSDILITNVAYQIALSIREAQVYGIGSKQRLDEGSFLKLGYGVNIKGGPTISDSDKATSYVFFADQTDGEGQYQYDAGDLIVEEADLPQGQKIRNLCGKNTSGDWSCWESAGTITPFDLNIVFVRPNPDPHIENGSSTYSEAIIVVESAIGDKCRTIRVTSTGQISVDPSDSTNGCDATN